MILTMEKIIFKKKKAKGLICQLAEKYLHRE